MATSADSREVKRRIAALFDELLEHDGFGAMSIEMRLLRRGQKEVIVHCGKQYRYVLDFAPSPHGVDRISDDVGS